MKTRAIVPVLLGIVAACMASCGGSDSGGPGPGDTTPPTIAARSPADGADDVGLIERVEITFSEAMDSSTISDSTITVAGRSPSGYVEYDSETRTVFVTPDTFYAAETWHDVVVSDGVTDEAGNPLATPDTSSFQTGTLDCDHLTDYLEPNDSAVDAAPVEVDRPYHTLGICETDMDYFVVDLPDTTGIDFHLLVRYAPLQWASLTLMRDDTDEPFFTRGWPTLETGEEHVVTFSFLPGAYRYRFSHGIGEGIVLYDVEFVAGEPCRDDAYEDNDWYTGAIPIQEGIYPDMRGCPGDGDYFLIELEAGNLLTFTVTTADDPIERRMQIFGPAGTELAVYSGDDNPSTIEAAAPESGGHTIHVRFWSGPTEYEMGVGVGD